jgi:hypothetical protein
MAPLRIHALRLRGTSRDYDVVFDRDDPDCDLAIVAGQSRTGKTSVLQFIDYCLGDSRHPTQRQFEQHVIAAMLEVSLNGRRHVIVRRLFEDKATVQIHATSLAQFAQAHAVEKRPVGPPGDPESLSALLLEQVGLDGISVKEAPTDPKSKRKALSFRNVSWLAYLPSRRLDNHTLLHEDRPSSDLHTYRQLLEIVFGVADERVRLAEAQLKETSDKVSRLRSEVRTIESFIDEAPATLDALDQQLAANDAARQQLAAQLAAVETQMRASEDYPSTLRQALQDASEHATRVTIELRDATTLRERLGPLRAQYGEDLKKLNFLQESGRLLNPLPVLLCPVCLNDLDDPHIEAGTCQLCGKTVGDRDHAEEADAVDVSKEIRATRASLSELNKYFAEVDERAQELEQQTRQARQKEATLQRDLDAQAQRAVAPFLAQRDGLQRQQVDLAAQRQRLQGQRQVAAKLAERYTRIGHLQAEQTRLSDALALLQAQRPDRDQVIAELSQRFADLLATFGFPELAGAALDANFAPMIDDAHYSAESSEGALTLISLAWQLTMFERLVETGGEHPGYLLIDSPQKNLTQREDDSHDEFSDPAIVARFYQHITDWLAARPGQAQIIIVDREPPDPYRHAVVKYYSRRAGRPPYGLIEDAVPSESEADEQP